MLVAPVAVHKECLQASIRTECAGSARFTQRLLIDDNDDRCTGSS